jgi:hypothetical protein
VARRRKRAPDSARSQVPWGSGATADDVGDAAAEVVGDRSVAVGAAVAVDVWPSDVPVALGDGLAVFDRLAVGDGLAVRRAVGVGDGVYECVG